MKTKKTLLGSIPLLVLVLELLPQGAVLNFANPEGDDWRKTFSYFDLTPFGYANFGPFVTALLTCALLVSIILYLIMGRKGLLCSAKWLSAIAVITSMMPILYGLRYITVIGAIITILLALEFILSFITEKTDGH